MGAAGGVDDSGTPRQQCQGAGVQYCFCLGGQRQQADEDLAAPEQTRQTAGTGIVLDSRDRLLAAAPGGDVEAEGLQLGRGVTAELTKAEDADPPVCGVLLIEL